MRQRMGSSRMTAYVACVATLMMASSFKPSSAQPPPGGPSADPAQPGGGDAYSILLKRRLNKVIDLEKAIRHKRKSLKEQLSDIVLDAEMDRQQAEGTYLNANLTRQIKEIEVHEYREGIAKGEEMSAKGEIELAETDLKRVMGRPARSIIDDLEREKTKIHLEMVQTRRKVLVEYSIPKRIAELQSEVKSALSEELAAQAMFELAKDRVEFAKRLVKTYKAVAPEDIVLTMMDDAILLEKKASVLLREAEIKAGEARGGAAQAKAAADLEKIRDEAAVLMRQAKEKLSIAIEIADKATASRVSLRHDEEKLREAYDELDGLKRVRELEDLVKDLHILNKITQPD